MKAKISIYIFLTVGIMLQGCNKNKELAEFEKAQELCFSPLMQYVLGKNNRDTPTIDGIQISVGYVKNPLGMVILKKIKPINSTKKVFIREFNNSNFKETQLDFTDQNTEIKVVSSAGFAPTNLLICTNSKI